MSVNHGDAAAPSIRAGKPHIVCVIFARGGSKGVPRKNIRPLAGKPLIAHAIGVAQQSALIDRVVVSTDDPEIAAVARQFGAGVPFMRPAELAGDSAPEWLAWQHAINTLNAEHAARPVDILVSVPTTAPLRSVVDVDACIQKLLDSDADLVLTVSPSERSPYFNMVTLDADNCARLMMSAGKSIHNRQDCPKAFDIATVAYAARARYVLSAQTLFEGHVKAVVVPRERALDIDTEMDFQIAEFMVSRGTVLE